MNYKYDDRSFKGIEKMSFQLHCPARQLQRIMNEFEKQGVVKKTGKGAYKLIEIWISDQFPIGIALEIDIWEIDTIGVEKEVLNVDDMIETANHFRCIDMIIDYAKAALTEKFIKELHLVLKNGTSDSRKEWFAVGDYKKLPNEVGGRDTALPEEVADKMKALELLSIGLINDMYAESRNDDCKYAELATQEDFDRF